MSDRVNIDGVLVSRSLNELKRNVPSLLKTFIDERLRNDGYGTASEYVRELVRKDQKRREEQKLEALLLQRLGNSKVEFDIQEVRTELAKRLAKKR